MANPEQQPYAEMVKRAQVTLLTMLETWNRTFQQTFGATPMNSELIDQTFDFADKLVRAQLKAQRQLAKQAAASGTAVAETVRAGTAQMTEALKGGSVL